MRWIRAWPAPAIVVASLGLALAAPRRLQIPPRGLVEAPPRAPRLANPIGELAACVGLGLGVEQAPPQLGRGIVQQISLQTLYLTPTLAVKLHPRIQLGAGLAVIKGAVSLRRSLVFSTSAADDVDVELSGDDWAVGATAGVLVRAIPDLLDVGLGFRSGASFTFTGAAAFTKDGSGAAVFCMASSLGSASPSYRRETLESPLSTSPKLSSRDMFSSTSKSSSDSHSLSSASTSLNSRSVVSSTSSKSGFSSRC